MAKNNGGSPAEEAARPTIGIKRLTPAAVLPVKAHASDSGYDLCAATDVVIAPGDTEVIPTGIAVKLPPGYEAQVRPRSGVSSKTKLRVAIGTVDQSYTGEVKVIVDNIAPIIDEEDYAYAPTKLNGDAWCKYDDGPYNYTTANSYIIRAGERIAQLVVAPVAQLEAVEIEDLGDSERGANGFGSTGVR